MALNTTHKVTIAAAIISGVFVIIAAIMSNQRGVEQQGERNVAIDEARDVQIDQSVRTSPPEAELTGLLMPANEPDPPHKCESMPSDAVKVFLGSNVSWTSGRDYMQILRIGGQDRITLHIKPQGVYLSAILFREDGREVTRIVNNKFLINPNNNFRRHRPDRHEISIFDKNDQRVLFVRYINEKAFYFEGVFHAPGRPPLIVTRDEMHLGGMKLSNYCSGNIFGPMFSYD